MPRQLSDWLESYMLYTSGTEAPARMHFWSGVSAIAGTLRRKVWVDMQRFKWYPNFYIIFVAPPGIVSKTTTMELSMSLLRKVPGINFGPDVVTWQALVGCIEAVAESFQYEDEWVPMSALTLASGELGDLINPQDRSMVNFYITMWDGKKAFEKVTKGSGNDMVEAPWVNLIGCTTPHWIADNMPAATVGGGFTSRCVFIYGDKKEQFIAWPDEFIQKDHDGLAAKLIHDLEDMATNLVGPISISEEARTWGRAWYKKLWTDGCKTIKDDRLEGYLARKQTHMVKLAMILSVSRGGSLEITLEDIVTANTMLEETEQDLDKVFAKIGRSEDSIQAERFADFVRRSGKISYEVAFRYIHVHFPDFREFEGMLTGLIRSGMIRMEFHGAPKMGPDGKLMQESMLVWVGG